MQKLLSLLVCVIAFCTPVYAATYNCQYQSGQQEGDKYVNFSNNRYVTCGHDNTNGCDNGVSVCDDDVCYECDSTKPKNKWVAFNYECKTDGTKYVAINDKFYLEEGTARHGVGFKPHSAACYQPENTCPSWVSFDDGDERRVFLKHGDKSPLIWNSDEGTYNAFCKIDNGEWEWNWCVISCNDGYHFEDENVSCKTCVADEEDNETTDAVATPGDCSAKPAHVTNYEWNANMGKCVARGCESGWCLARATSGKRKGLSNGYCKRGDKVQGTEFCVSDENELNKSQSTDPQAQKKQPAIKTNKTAEQMLEDALNGNYGLVDAGYYSQCDSEKLREAINNGVNVNNVYKDFGNGTTYLMAIVEQCKTEDIKFVLDNVQYDIEWDKTDANGNTAFEYLTLNTFDNEVCERAKALIKAGADYSTLPKQIEQVKTNEFFVGQAKCLEELLQRLNQKSQNQEPNQPVVDNQGADNRNECEKENADYTVCDVMDNKCVLKTKCDAKKKINQAKAKLTAIENANLTRKSVWKDENGEFNTARLASDSVAGAVLGTAGGIITNSVIKKNQTEKGLESVRCYIGARPLARFGDKFWVSK